MSTNSPIALPVSVIPSIWWIRLAMQRDAIVDIHEHYVKQTIRNRFEILGVNGPLTLTIPVVGQKGVKTPTKDIQIAEGNWKKLHLAAIRSAYGRSAYFEHYFPDLQDAFEKKESNLLGFSQSILKWMNQCGLALPLHYSESYMDQPMEDYRPRFEPQMAWPTLPAYPQVFSDRFPFQSNLSVIDLVMNKGPQAMSYLQNIDLHVLSGK
jgi:hypothetical protein